MQSVLPLDVHIAATDLQFGFVSLCRRGGGRSCLLLSSKKSGSIEPPMVGRFCPVVGHPNATKRCAITVIIERRTDVRNRPIRTPFPALSPAVKPPQASYRPHVRLTGAYVAFRNRISNRGGPPAMNRVVSNAMVSIPLHWNGKQWYPMDCNPFHGMPIDIVLRHGNGGSGKRTNEFGGVFTTIWATP